MIRRPPRSTHCISSAASDVYKRQYQRRVHGRSLTKTSSKGDIIQTYYRDKIYPSLNILTIEPLSKIINLDEFQQYLSEYMSKRRVEIQKREEEDKKRKESEIQEQQKQQEQKAKVIQERKQIFEEMQRKKEERQKIELQLRKKEEEKFLNELDNHKLKQQEIFSGRQVRAHSNYNDIVPYSARKAQIDAQKISQQDKRLIRIPTLNSPPSTERKMKNLQNLQQIDKKIFYCGVGQQKQSKTNQTSGKINQYNNNVTNAQSHENNQGNRSQATHHILLNREDRKMENYLPLKIASQLSPISKQNSNIPQKQLDQSYSQATKTIQNLCQKTNPMGLEGNLQKNEPSEKQLMAKQCSIHNRNSTVGNSLANTANPTKKQNEVVLMVRENNQQIEKILHRKKVIQSDPNAKQVLVAINKRIILKKDNKNNLSQRSTQYSRAEINSPKQQKLKSLITDKTQHSFINTTLDENFDKNLVHHGQRYNQNQSFTNDKIIVDKDQSKEDLEKLKQDTNNSIINPQEELSAKDL
eukprot:TRINITY_DN9782_c0_g2_i4.p1 TRINITY_DN9782_c0_g2~~TRINITY_DN9782_c0_g2_i4.p1  ORF type:complete len:525 (-),score=135.07 TRINITY_DN9782_c0_g2_i4:13-1587(-)